jgi:hypothetical protein
MAAMWTGLLLVFGHVGRLTSQAGHVTSEVDHGQEVVKASALTGSSEGREPDFGIAPNLTRVQEGVSQSHLSAEFGMFSMYRANFVLARTKGVNECWLQIRFLRVFAPQQYLVRPEIYYFLRLINIGDYFYSALPFVGGFQMYILSY